MNSGQGTMSKALGAGRRALAEEVPVGYKRTDVGMIPEDWDVDRIDKNTSIKTGSKNTQDRQKDGDYPFFVRSQEVERINSYSYDGEAVLTAGDEVGTGPPFESQSIGGGGGDSKSPGEAPGSRWGAMPPRAVALRRSPREGGTPPSEPPFESHPLLGRLRGYCGSTFCLMALVTMAEGVFHIRFAKPL